MITVSYVHTAHGICTNPEVFTLTKATKKCSHFLYNGFIFTFISSLIDLKTLVVGSFPQALSWKLSELLNLVSFGEFTVVAIHFI